MSSITSIRKRIDEVEQAGLRAENAPHPTGGDGGGTDMEARVAKLEAHVEHIQSDVSDIKTDLRTLRDKIDSHFNVTFGSLIFVALGLAGIMAKGFGWL